MNKDERTALLRSKLTPVTVRTERIWTKGAYQDLPIYRAPTEMLYLNDDNRRFRAEAQEAAVDLGRKLDPTTRAVDQESIISLLLDREPRVEEDRVVGKPSKETLALLSDWEKRGQEKPFWIRPDGLVVNGNRRLAMIRREQKRRGLEFGDWVEVVIFSEDEYDDDILFDLEAREQLTEGLKVRYSDINILLTLSDAAERIGIVWENPASIKAVASGIQDLVNNNPTQARDQLNAVKYMKLYLEYVGFPEEYYRLIGMVERFRAVGQIMAWIAEEDPAREDAMLNMLFSGVQAGSTHLDLRDLRTLLKNDPDEFDRTINYIRDLEEEVEAPEDEEEPPAEGEFIEDIEEEEDEEEGSVEPSPESIPAPPSYPKHSVKRALDNAVQGVRDAKRNDKRAQVMSAARRLGDIRANDLRPYLSAGAEAERLRVALETIIGWAEEMRSLVAGNAAGDPQ
jgi:hypothetical protein